MSLKIDVGLHMSADIAKIDKEYHEELVVVYHNRMRCFVRELAFGDFMLLTDLFGELKVEYRRGTKLTIFDGEMLDEEQCRDLLNLVEEYDFQVTVYGLSTDVLGTVSTICRHLADGNVNPTNQRCVLCTQIAEVMGVYRSKVVRMCIYCRDHVRQQHEMGCLSLFPETSVKKRLDFSENKRKLDFEEDECVKYPVLSSKEIDEIIKNDYFKYAHIEGDVEDECTKPPVSSSIDETLKDDHFAHIEGDMEDSNWVEVIGTL